MLFTCLCQYLRFKSEKKKAVENKTYPEMYACYISGPPSP